MTYKAYTEEVVQDIANAIREKSGKTDKMRITRMAQEIRELKAGHTKPIVIRANGVYSSSNENEEGLVGYDPVTVLSDDTVYLGNHVDENGKWVRPDDWDDIESQVLAEDRDDIWLLYNLKGEEKPYCAWYTRGVTAFTMEYDIGRIVDGEFNVLTTRSLNIKASSGGTTYFLVPLAEFAEDNDYIVIHCRLPVGAYFQQFYPNNWIADSYIASAASSTHQSLIARYCTLARIQTYKCNVMSLESDRVVGLGKNLPATTAITLNGAYYNASNLQRLIMEDWEIAGKNISNVENFLRNCISVSDFGRDDRLDFSGWLSDKSTASNLNYFMYECKSVSAIVDMSDWNFSRVTTAQNSFYNCGQLQSIVGIDTWRNMTSSASYANIFSGCKKLRGVLDFSNSGLKNITSLSSAFMNCQCLESIIFDNCDFSSLTTIYACFQDCKGLKHVSFGGSFVPPSSKCTNYSRMFWNASAIDELILTGWDFSGSSLSSDAYFANGATKLRVLKLVGCTSPSSTTTSDGTVSLFANCKNLEVLDVSDFDASMQQHTNGWSTSFNTLDLLVDFYPPSNIQSNRSFSINGSPRLSNESLQRLIDAITPVSSGTGTLTIGAYNISKLTDEQKALVQSKGMTLA